MHLGLVLDLPPKRQCIEEYQIMLEKIVKVLNMTNLLVVIAQHTDKFKVSGRKVSTSKTKCIDKVDKCLVSIIEI